jgi:tRNA-dihydrouridine synthase C
MEGLVDAVMRDLLTQIGGIDRCVTEFVRVSDAELPARVFYRLAPELHTNGCTAAGVPVWVQLLGSDPDLLAANALQAALLGAPGIDLNFGCPAKTVIRNKGGALLLKNPALIHKIVTRVRAALPEHIPLSAKMRLGYEDKSLALENAQAIEEGGAQELCVHARTKVEGYRPPAHWEWIARIREQVSIPVVGNGEVWTVQDYRRCVEVSGCDDIMIGRGLVARPDLACLIRGHLAGRTIQPLGEFDISPLLQHFFQQVRDRIAPKHAPGRLKQWLLHLRRSYPAAQQLFDRVRGEMQVEPILEILQQWSAETKSQREAQGLLLQESQPRVAGVKGGVFHRPLSALALNRP